MILPSDRRGPRQAPHKLRQMRISLATSGAMRMAGQARLRIGIDTGGTFTDIVSVDSRAGTMRVTKVASTPSNPAIGLVRGVEAILAREGGSAADVAGLAHGTTVATNALLQG